MTVKIPIDYFKMERGTPKIVQIGCGGTGSLLVPYIARLISNEMNDDNEICYKLVDGDKVMKKNIIRQNFITADILHFKSDVLAKRYSQAMSIDITSAPVYINDTKTLDALCGDNVDILVSCVDNNKTRKIIADWLENKNPYMIWLDAGNELLGGQVFVQGRSSSGKITSLIEVHPEIADGKDKLPGELSCAEHLARNEQSLAVNSTAAMTIFNILNTLLKGEKLYYYEVDFTVSNSFRKKFLDDWKAK